MMEAISRRAAETDLEQLLARAREWGPVLAERAAEADRLRRLPEETVEELHHLGFLKVLQPRRYGGLEMNWGDHIRVAAELARHCGSTAWIQCVVGSHVWLAARMDERAQDEIFAVPDVLVATAFAGGRDVRVEAVDDGFRLRGRWRFASGIEHAQWIIVGAQTEASSRDRYEMKVFALPRDDVSVHDTWDSSGLRGTGSHDIEVADVFVPRHRSAWLKSVTGGLPAGSGLHDSYVYRVEMSPYFSTNLLGPVLGAARGAFESYLGQTRSRVGAMFGERVAEQIPVQSRIAESSGEIAAAGLLIERILDELHARGARGQAVSRAERVRHRRDATLAARLCDTAVTRVVRMMGASGLSGGNPTQRAYNDLRAMISHQSLQWDHCTTPYGRWALGLPTGDEAMDRAEAGDDRLY